MFANANATKEGREEGTGVLEELYGQEKERIYRATFNNEYSEYEHKRPAGAKVMLLGVAGGAVDEGVYKLLHDCNLLKHVNKAPTFPPRVRIY